MDGRFRDRGHSRPLLAAYFAAHLNDQPSETPAAAPIVTRVEPNAFAEGAPQTRVEHVRVVYREHRNGLRANRPRAVTFDVRQTVAQTAPPVTSSTIFLPPHDQRRHSRQYLHLHGLHEEIPATAAGRLATRRQPFNVGSAENIVIRNQGPIEPGWVTVGGVDLYNLIQKKCAAAC